MAPIDIGAVVVALIAAAGAWASQRAASRATTVNTAVSTRMDSEKEAYERARSFDIATIERQDEELKFLRAENDRLNNEVTSLNMRIRRLELFMPSTLEGMLRDRLEEPGTDDKEQ